MGPSSPETLMGSLSSDTGPVPGRCAVLCQWFRGLEYGLWFFSGRTQLSYLLGVGPRAHYSTSRRLSLHSSRKQKQFCFRKDFMNERLRGSVGWCPGPGLYEGLGRWLLGTIVAIVVNSLPARLHLKDQQVQAE